MSVAEAVAVGQELPSLAKEMTQRRIDVFSGVKPRSSLTLYRPNTVLPPAQDRSRRTLNPSFWRSCGRVSR